MAPLLPFDPVKGDLNNPLQAPTWGAHPLGSDHQGRDIVVRLIHGANVSITVGFLAVFVSWAAVTVVAVTAGIFKGWVDGPLIQITAAFMALPFLMVAVTVVSLLAADQDQRDPGAGAAPLDELCPDVEERGAVRH